MASMWTNSTIGELCDQGHLFIQTGPFGSQLHAHDYQATGVPVIPTEAIGRRVLHTHGLPLVAEETAERLARHRVRVGDILFARRGVQATGLSAIVQVGQENWICGTGAILLRSRTGLVDPQFLSFWLASDNSINWLKTHAVGAVMPNLNEGVLRGLPLVLPPLPEQRAIAAVLGALDDKIELNRRMNQTLEQIAQALFKSWFVDFDPVHANRNGETKSGLAKGVQALFPDEFMDDELYIIPCGWKAGTIGDLIVERTIRVGSQDCVVLSAVQTGHLVRSSDHFDKRVYSQDTAKYKLVEQSDYAYNPSRINIGSIGMLEDNVIGAVSPAYTVFRPSKGYEWYLRFIFREANIRESIAQLCSGSVRQSLAFRDLVTIPITIPPIGIVRLFSSMYLTFKQGQLSFESQSSDLAVIRDTLLPKLLSGEVRVREAEKIVEEIL